jgi:protein involved in polysaccharide export with SLBB domain
MTLMGVIDRAGGLPYKVKKVKILRDKKELIYDLRKINPDGSNNPVLMDGDQIIVPGG